MFDLNPQNKKNYVKYFSNNILKYKNVLYININRKSSIIIIIVQIICESGYINLNL